jgi:hypothetical protein
MSASGHSRGFIAVTDTSAVPQLATIERTLQIGSERREADMGHSDPAAVRPE